MENPVILVSQQQYDSLVELLTGSAIADRNGSCKTLLHQGQEYIVSGGAGNGAGGWHDFNGYRVVLQSAYKGKLKPLPYDQHYNDVAIGNRSREYTGMSFRSGKRQMVVMEPVTFQASHEVKQLSLF